ncbi:hypothetical protein F4861DRAFT_535218 [Xylaria intraflava]|nr:hypothetical protein F4861DRAFT_535218 [Xylaria intraflava]
MMFITALLTASFASFVSGIRGFELPCSAVSGTPCRCPFGTDYSESVTTAIIGATAADVGKLTNDFFNPLWAGLDPFILQGPDDSPGLSIRELNLSTSVGTYSFSELLTFRFVFPDGTFEQKYEQKGEVSYRSGNGSFSGHWVTLRGDRIFQNETLVRLSDYACQTGHPIDFASNHESALKNATSILAAAGKIYGVNTNPESVQSF